MNIGDVINAIEAEAFNEVLEKENSKYPYEEILKLEQMLRNEGIPYEVRNLYDGFQIGYPIIDMDMDNRICSAVQHFGSYGSQDGLIEIMGLTQNGDEVEGYLSAEEVFNRISKHYNSCDEIV